MMTGKELAERLTDIASNYRTLYAWGCFGAAMTDKNKSFYTRNDPFSAEKLICRDRKISEAKSS